MAPTILQFKFPFNGPWGEKMSAALQELAQDIATEDGLVWKIWMENETEGSAGGSYLFRDAKSAERYRNKHERRLASLGLRDVVVDTFTVNQPLSIATHAPLSEDIKAPSKRTFGAFQAASVS